MKALLEINEVAKIISVGRNELYEILKDKKILKKHKGHNNQPYQKLINEGYFVVQEKTYEKSTSSVKEVYRPYVTEKGLAHIKNVVEQYRANLA